jgi:predicted nucleic-acid-binding protein
VRAVETNILARYYLRDDATQARIARDLLSTGDLFVPKTVVLELEGCYGMSPISRPAR